MQLKKLGNLKKIEKKFYICSSPFSLFSFHPVEEINGSSKTKERRNKAVETLTRCCNGKEGQRVQKQTKVAYELQNKSAIIHDHLYRILKS